MGTNKEKGIWTTTSTISNPKDLKGKPFLFGKMKMLERSQKINTRFNDICLIQLLISIPLCQMIKMEIIKPTLDDGIALLLILFYGGYIPRPHVFMWLSNIKTITIKMSITTSKLSKNIWKEKMRLLLETFFKDSNFFKFYNKMYDILERTIESNHGMNIRANNSNI